jgi:hypothetical protein
MGHPCLKHGLVLVTLAALVGGCATSTGPRAKVEDRRVPGADRSKAVASKAKTSPRKAEKPQREERQVAKEPASLTATSAKDAAEPAGARAIGDAMSGDQVLEIKPERHTSRFLR